jgi:hypothetical protein
MIISIIFLYIIIMNSDICEIISNYIYKSSYKLLDWININKLNWHNLSSNPNAISLLKENPDKIDWMFFNNEPKCN